MSRRHRPASGSLLEQLQEARESDRRRGALLRELREIDRDRTLRPMEAALLRALAHVQAGHAGRERVKRATLAEWIGCHPLSIPRIARRLEAAGRIVRVPCYDRGGRQSGNQWILGPVGPGGVTRTRQRAPRSWSGEPSELPGYAQRGRARQAPSRRGAPSRARGNPSGHPLRVRASSPLRGGAGIVAAAPDPGATSQERIGRAHPAQIPDPAASGRGAPTAPGRTESRPDGRPQPPAAPRDPRLAALLERATAASRNRHPEA